MEQKLAQEILGPKTSRDLEGLIKSGLLENFYLAGGTGAALILHHRQSYDLDFFSQNGFPEDRLAANLARLGRLELEKKETGTLNGLWEHTRLSFFHYPYRLLREPQLILNVKVADLIDIACMKLDAVAGRGSKKDFIDLYEIIRHGHPLKELLVQFEKKYAPIKYNLTHIKKGLVYFADADEEQPPIMIKPLDWKKIKEFFISEIKKL